MERLEQSLEIAAAVSSTGWTHLRSCQILSAIAAPRYQQNVLGIRLLLSRDRSVTKQTSSWSDKLVWVCFHSTPCLNKTAFLFLSELHQISTNFNKFWQVDDKMAKIVCCINIFHLTWPTSRLTLRNTDILNCYITLKCIICKKSIWWRLN